jgi:predicted DCC family thiol-disulfide oxidoreductase YuxK
VGEAVEFVPFQEGMSRAPGVPVEALRREVHLIREDGRIATGAEAVILTLASRTRRHPVLWMYRHVPGFAMVAEWVYRRVASNRHRAPW